MSGDQLQADVSKLKRICLRLDNGTRIGFPSALGIDSAAKVVKLDFVEGFSRGIVSEADLNRISEIAGQLETQRLAAAAPGTKAKVPQQPSVKKEKRQRVQKTQLEIPDIWVQKGIRVLDTVGKQRFAGWFKEPVKPTTDYVPDYFNIVKNPMDLGTVREKLRAGQYASTQAFAKDLDLIWDNAILYNGDQVDIGKTAIELKRLTRQSLKQAGLDLGIGSLDAGRAKRLASDAAVRPEREAVSSGAAKRPRGAASKHLRAASTHQDPVTSSARAYEAAQRNTLALKLEALDLDKSQEELMEQISVIVAPHAASDGQEIELDVTVLPDELCWKIHDLVAHIDVSQTAEAVENPRPQLTGVVSLDDEETDIE